VEPQPDQLSSADSEPESHASDIGAAEREAQP
jgi:hypothetical protein